MLEKAIKLLQVIHEKGYEAYIVGGFVRDTILNIKSNDIDIATNASPKELKEIFEEAVLPKEKYGSVSLMYQGIVFEITTYRREIKYDNTRRPIEIEYIDDIYEDLIRRDFTINAICIDKDGQYFDPLKGKIDLEKKVIRAIGNADSKLKEDPLRILRAIRFATNLNFKVDQEVKDAIFKNKQRLVNISYQRKKEELSKIFLSINALYGKKILLELNIDSELELSNLRKVTEFTDLIGVWAQLDVMNIYPFTKNEKVIIRAINSALTEDILDKRVILKYGLYVISIVASIKGISRNVITKKYNDIPIKRVKEIAISVTELCTILEIEPGEVIRTIYRDLFDKIIDNELENDKKVIKNYLTDNLDLYQKLT